MSLLLVLHILVVGMFTTRILLRDDLSPPARLAWFIVLLGLPIFGSVVYFLFGEVDLRGKARRTRAAIFDTIKYDAAADMGEAEKLTALIERPYQAAFKYAASVNGFHPMAGNTAELMADSARTHARMIADIDAATDHVHVLYYIWLGDRTGTALAEALIRAVRRGVTCRAMADGLGSRVLIRSALWRRMRDAGVQMAVALPLNRPIRTLLNSRIDLRNHRKITVIDGQITYCGSRNSADPEFKIKANYAPWIDIMLRFRGPVVAQNQLLFATDWMDATGERLARCAVSSKPAKDGFPAQALGFGPTERKGATPHLFSTAIGCARATVTLSTPYFVPDATVLESLRAAAFRGVVVTLIFPKLNDNWIVAAASRSYYRALLEAGCIIHEFTGGLLHAKTLTIDDKISLIGSSNLDLRSFDLNYENNILLQDTEITSQIQGRQAEYIADSELVSLDTVINWPYRKRIWHNVIATIGPIL
ncbi:cardiolipin synthase [Sulfitobacter sp. MF3-043]|uniref:cardiolipin synthase n=1 Tax=Sulfitobacter sediminivivens TaxID=3252902 RepID=UPI0036D830E9